MRVATGLAVELELQRDVLDVVLAREHRAYASYADTWREAVAATR